MSSAKDSTETMPSIGSAAQRVSPRSAQFEEIDVARDEALRGQIEDAERIAFEDDSPISLRRLKELMSYLNAKTDCAHDFAGALQFIECNELDAARVLPWLQEHGAHCDCEVIYNVYDALGELLGWHLDSDDSAAP